MQLILERRISVAALTPTLTKMIKCERLLVDATPMAMADLQGEEGYRLIMHTVVYRMNQCVL